MWLLLLLLLKSMVVVESVHCFSGFNGKVASEECLDDEAMCFRYTIEAGSISGCSPDMRELNDVYIERIWCPKAGNFHGTDIPDPIMINGQPPEMSKNASDSLLCCRGDRCNTANTNFCLIYIVFAIFLALF
ncbi:unnamed protein product, partial [Mesorhabditis spiculigera]